jgi:predicted GIY-YIG superfamily endonuclease
MHYVYIIKNEKSKNLYIGYAINPVRRLKEHNSGLSTHTKKYLPWRFVYLEGYAEENDARNREKILKQFGKVYSQLKRRIRHSLDAQKVRG